MKWTYSKTQYIIDFKIKIERLIKFTPLHYIVDEGFMNDDDDIIKLYTLKPYLLLNSKIQLNK